MIVSQVFFPDTQSTSQLLTTLAKALSPSTGDEVDSQSPSSVPVTVLCGHPSKARGKLDAAPNADMMRRITIRRGGLKTDGKVSLFHRALSYGSYLAWLTIQLLTQVNRKTDHVMVVTNPPFAPILVYLCQRFRGLFGASFRYTILLHDLYPDGLIALGSLQRSKWWVRIWTQLNRWSFCKASSLITLGRDMSAHCHKHYGVPTRQMTVIPNWSPVDFADAQICKPHETKLWSTLPSELRESDPLLVQYSGNMGLWHNMDAIVDAAAELQDLPIHFLMIGDGRRKAAAIERASKLKLQNMTWLPFQPLETLTDSLQCAHLSLVSQRSDLLGIMVPSKFYGVLASGRGVIAQVPSDSEVGLAVAEHECGVVLNTAASERLAVSLRTLYGQPEVVAAMGKAARDSYVNYYSFNKAVEAFKRCLL